MAGAIKAILVLNRLHWQDKFKKCAAIPFACIGFVSQLLVSKNFSISQIASFDKSETSTISV